MLFNIYICMYICAGEGEKASQALPWPQQSNREKTIGLDAVNSMVSLSILLGAFPKWDCDASFQDALNGAGIKVP